MAATASQIADAIRVQVHDHGLQRWLKRCYERAPARTRTLMGQVTAYWSGDAKRAAPVYTGKNKAKRGHGFLKSSIQSKVFGRGETIVGSVYTSAFYAAYLEFGTDTIAGGRVKAWEPGMPVISRWPAKVSSLGDTQMPYVRPFVPKWASFMADKLAGIATEDE